MIIVGKVMMLSLLTFVIFVLVFMGSTSADEPGVLGGGGGLASGWLFLSPLSLNDRLEANGFAPLGERLLLIGGGGFGARIDSWAVGGLVARGSEASTKLNRIARLSLSYGGFLIEYGELVTESFGLSIGGLLGVGDANLQLGVRPVDDFNSALLKPHGTSLSKEFFVIKLYVGGEFFPLKGLRVRATAGYLWTVGVTNWKADSKEVPGPLENFSAPLVQLMIFFES